MQKLPPNTKGFGLIAVLAVVVVLGVVGGGGAYVYHQNHKTKPATQATTTSKSGGFGSTKPAPPTPKADAAAFKVPQLGIEIANVPAAIQDLTDAVTVSDTGGTSVSFSTSSLTALDSGCSAGSTGIGSLERVPATYPPSQTYLISFVKQFDGFWIGFGGPQGACSANGQAQALASSQHKLFGALVTNPANIEALN